jgi:FkbM family methyltransferase
VQGEEIRSAAVTAVRDHFVDELRFVAKGDTLRDRWRLARMLVRIHARVGRLRSFTGWLPSPEVHEFDLSLRDGPSLRLRSDDVVLAFIYATYEYDVDFSPLTTVNSILDLGANVGLGAIYLAGRLSPETLVCVEPSPDTFRRLQENLRRNLPTALAINAAAVGREGSYQMVDGKESAGFSRVVRGEGEIEGLTVDQILARAGLDSVDLMKVDIEGSEAAIFEQAEEWGARVGAILGEVHPPLTVAMAESRLAVAGFEPLPVPDRPVFEDIVFVHRPTRAAG